MNDNQRTPLRVGPYVGTRKQVEVVEKTETEAVELFQKLVWLSIEARDSNVFRGVNEHGERVQHAANQIMANLEENYFLAAQSLLRVVPEKDGQNWFPWMYLRNIRARGDLPAWMQWLVDKNGGDVRLAWDNSDVKSDNEVGCERLAAKQAAGTDTSFELGGGQDG